MNDNANTRLRILVVGAGPTGAAVLRQLEKNPRLEPVVLDSTERPYAVTQGIIDEADIKEGLTPLSLEYILDMARPDLILWTLTTEDLALGVTPGVDALTQALRDEIAAIADVPVIEVARR